MSAFPGNIVDELKTGLIGLPNPTNASVNPTVVGRPVRPTDPNITIGVVAEDWVPEGWEIGLPNEPAIQRYTFKLQVMVKHAQEEEGRAMHSALSKSMRAMVFRDDALRVALRGLVDTDAESGVVERATRYAAGRQRFLSTVFKGTFLFVSSLDLWVETQIAG